jgi:hypothetical protein
MPTYQHPRIAPGDDVAIAVDLGGYQVVTDTDGQFEAEQDADVEALATAYRTTPEAMRVDTDDPETCDVVKQDGEVCGRQTPCPYHGD